MTVQGSAILLNEQPQPFRRKTEFIRQQAVGKILVTKEVPSAYTAISDDAGFHLISTSAVDANWTLPADFATGLWFIVTQTGLGRASFVAGAGATVVTALAAARTRAQYSQVRVDVVSNPTGVAATFVVSGDAG